MSPRSALAIGLALLLLPPLGAAAAEPAEPAVAWWEGTLLDRDRDRIDDALAGRAGPVRVLIDYAAPPSHGDLAALAALGAEVLHVFRVVPVAAAVVDASALPAVARAPGVVLVEHDAPLRPLLDESRPLVRADVVHERLRVTGRGVSVAVLDTGVDTGHGDLAPRIAASHDASLPGTVHLVAGLLGREAPAVATDTEGHGTHVAGIAAGPGTSSGGRYAGLAAGARIVNVKVFDATGNASSSYVIKGIDWVLDHRDAYAIRVMQMSLGGRPTDGTDALSRAVDEASRKGVLTVAAAGNEGPDAGTVGMPGVARSAVTVGAVDKRLRLAAFSSRGPTPDGREKPDLVAPGVDITSTMPAFAADEGAYGGLSGTSMAAPHVAGVAAMMFEANASLAPARAKAILLASARGLGPSPGAWDPGYGLGFLDAETAVRAARDPSILDGLADLPPLPQPGLPEALAQTVGEQVEDARRAVPGGALAGALAVALAAWLRRR